MPKHGTFATLVPRWVCNGSAQKFATLAGGYYPPLQRPEISAQEIRWHRLRRGGYQPPGCFPTGETTSAQSADNAIPNICKCNSAVSCRNMVYLQHCYITGPIRFCPEICHVGGRLIAVELLSDRPRRSLDFDSLRGAPPLQRTEITLAKISMRRRCNLPPAIEPGDPQRCGTTARVAGSS